MEPKRGSLTIPIEESTEGPELTSLLHYLMNGGAMETTLSSTTNYWSVRQ